MINNINNINEDMQRVHYNRKNYNYNYNNYKQIK